MRQERLRSLTTAERKAYDTPLEKRTTRKTGNCSASADKKVRITHEDVAYRIGQKDRAKGAKALQIARKAMETERKLSEIESQRTIVNFEYWQQHAKVEQTAEARAARKAIYLAEQARGAQDLAMAAKMYAEAFAQWRLVLDKPEWPDLKRRDTVGRELIEYIRDYRKLLENEGQPFPKDFILQDVWDLHEKKLPGQRLTAHSPVEPLQRGREFLAGLGQPLDRLRPGAAGIVHDDPLRLAEFRGRAGHFAGDLQGNVRHAVGVAVQEVALSDHEPAHADRQFQVQQVAIGVRADRGPGEDRVLEGPDLQQVAAAARGDQSHRAETLVDRAHHLAKRGPDRRVVEVLKDHDGRAAERLELADLLQETAVCVAAGGRRPLRNAAVQAKPTIGGSSGKPARIRPSMKPVLRGRTSNSSITLQIVGVSNWASFSRVSREMAIDPLLMPQPQRKLSAVSYQLSAIRRLVADS